MADASGRLSDLLTPDRVVLPLGAADKPAAMAELTRALVSGSEAAYDEVLAAVLEREREMSTAVGLGVAIPHGRAGTLTEVRVAAGVAAAPIEWRAADGDRVRLLFMVVGPRSGAGEHLKALARIARIVRDDASRERLVDCRTPQEFLQALRLAEGP